MKKALFLLLIPYNVAAYAQTATTDTVPPGAKA